LQQAKPIPVEDFLKQGKLRRADVVLCRGKRSFFSWLIRWATRSRFSHAAIVFVIPNEDLGFQNTFLIESVISGVDITDLRHYVIEKSRDYDVAIKRLESPWFSSDPDGKEVRRLIRGSMLDFIKADYDFATIGRIALRVFRQLVFGLRVRVSGLERTLRRTYAKNRLAPGYFICSGFVQYGFYDAVRKLVRAGRLTGAELDEVVFNPRASARPDTAKLLSTTPEDLAGAQRLTWKYVIIDRHVYEVATQEEAYALIARKGTRHRHAG
jgi:hypothetical protein